MLTLLGVLILLTTTSAERAEATATRLDGTTIVGQLTSWDGQKLEVLTKEGPVQLGATDLLSLRWPTEAPAEVAEKSPLQPVVELIDGSVLPIESFERQGNEAHLVLRGNLPSDAKKIRVTDRAVASVRLQPLQESAARQWEEIRTQQFPSDLLVVLKRGGASLDYAEGSIGEVSAESLEVKLDGEPQRIPTSKVAGVIFYRAGRAPETEPLCVLEDRDGLRASVVSISLGNGSVQITTVAGAKLVWPLENVQSADFSAGKVVFLSDAEPASEEQKPLVGMPTSAVLAATYGRPRRDQSAFGGPLMLWFPGTDSLASAGRTQTFGRGLAVRSRTVLVYRVPKGFTRLLGVAGVEPGTRGDGSSRLTIVGDDRPLLDAELTGNQSPQNLELDITGVKRLKIVVDYGQNLDTGDWVNLCDVRMVK